MQKNYLNLGGNWNIFYGNNKLIDDIKNNTNGDFQIGLSILIRK